jgi:hypothetical protein
VANVASVDIGSADTGLVTPPKKHRDGVDTPEKLFRAMENLDLQDPAFVFDEKEVQIALGNIANNIQPEAVREGEVVLESDCEEAKGLRDAIEANDVQVRSSLGTRFTRSVKADPEEQGKYAKCKSWESKREFRMEWARRKLEDLTVARSRTRTYARVDTTRGEYVCFGLLVESYGIQYDRNAAVLAATRYASKCLKMGGQWLNKDSLGEVMEYLKIKKEFADTMSDAWRLCEVETRQTKLIDESTSGGSGETDASIEAKKPAAKADAAKKRLTSVGSHGGGECTGAKKAKHRSKLDEELAQAFKVKTLYLQTISGAKSLQTVVETCEDWAWARTDKSIGRLTFLINELEGSLDADSQRVVLEDLKVLKVEIGEDTLVKILGKFSSMKAKIDAVAAKQKNLLIAHRQLK